VLDHETRGAILRLAREGHGTRFIARAVGVARKSVKRVVANGEAEVPALERPDQLGEHVERVRKLHLACRGNLVRVHEELRARHEIEVPYSTLTRFCRDAGIGVAPKQAAGRYAFEPGEEMQHDTSPHEVVVGGRTVRLQCASLVMCFSRRRFVQCYPRWTRFHAKVFLTRALAFLGGAAGRCMLDNSTVIMTGGTGPDARAVPEMQAFADRFGFQFAAHRLGDANRSARVEGPFWHVEHNFYPGRTFADLGDLNAQVVAWCQTYNATFHRSFGGIPDELGVLERLALRPLPPFVPEPTEVHPRRVDTEGYVSLHRNRYSVPEVLVGRQLEVHETIDHVRVFDGRRLVAEHTRHEENAGVRLTLPEHRSHLRRRSEPRPPSPEEVALRAAGPALAALCDALRKIPVRGRRAIVRLHRIWLDYPTEAVEPAVRRALDFGLTDPDRIEQMVLRSLRGDFFRLPQEDDDG
jgi:hypothetical protein